MSELPIGKRISIPGHFDVPVILEDARPLDKGFECRFRLPDGSLEEAVITAEEAAALASAAAPVEAKATTVNAEQLRLLVESARIRAAQDRVMALCQKENVSPDFARARSEAEKHLKDLHRIRQERMAGLNRLEIARTGPVRHLATALVVPLAHSMGDGSEVKVDWALDDLEPELKRKIELAAEDVVIAYEKSRGWECERVGHLKIGFDIRSYGPADPQTGYRDPVRGIRRIEVNGRKKGATIQLTVNEWYRAV